MKTIKVYCTNDEKERVQTIAKAEGLNTSKYLLRRGLNDLHERATLAELIGCMVQLIEALAIDKNIKSDLLAIGSEVLEGGSTLKARARILEVCKNANKGD